MSRLPGWSSGVPLHFHAAGGLKTKQKTFSECYAGSQAWGIYTHILLWSGAVSAREKFRDSSLTFQMKKWIYPHSHLSTWLQQRPAEHVDWSWRANMFYFIKSLHRRGRKRRERTGASESWLEFERTNVSLRLMYSKIIWLCRTDKDRCSCSHTHWWWTNH